MPRIRSIKPEFWSSEQVMACTRDARLLFVGLWNFVDDAGRCSNSAKTIKAQVLPGDDDVDATHVRRWLDELSAKHLIREYEIDGRAYLQVTGWHHQRIDKPRLSKIPDPPIIDVSSNSRGSVAPDLILSDPKGADLTGVGVVGKKKQEVEPAAGSLASALPTGALARPPSAAARPTSKSLEEIVKQKGWVR